MKRLLDSIGMLTMITKWLRRFVRKLTVKGISIPVIVDDMKHLSNFGFGRCWYFTVECYTPSHGWVLGLRGRHIPFLMIGLSGIIHRPHFWRRLFTSPKQIENLLNTIEEDDVLHVGTADVWIPNTLIEPLLEKHKLKPQGAAFRVGYDLFCAAMDFRNDRLDRKQFEERASSMRGAVTFSGEENSAFAAWRQMQVSLAREQYPKDKELALSWSSRQGTSGA